MSGLVWCVGGWGWIGGLCAGAFYGDVGDRGLSLGYSLNPLGLRMGMGMREGPWQGVWEGVWCFGPLGWLVG